MTERVWSQEIGQSVDQFFVLTGRPTDRPSIKSKIKNQKNSKISWSFVAFFFCVVDVVGPKLKFWKFWNFQTQVSKFSIIIFMLNLGWNVLQEILIFVWRSTLMLVLILWISCTVECSEAYARFSTEYIDVCYHSFH